MSEIDYKQLVTELLAQSGDGVRLKNVPSSTPTASYGHGQGGLFSAAGLSNQIFSAMLLPKVGLQAQLPVRSSFDTNPLYGILTGVTASSGSEPTGVCDDPPVAGLAKLCTHSFVFGRNSRMTKVYDIDRVGKMTNRGEFTDLQLYGNAFAAAAPNPGMPTQPGFNAQAVAQNELAKAMFELGAIWSRDFARLTYTANPTNNTAGGGYAEWFGLDMLINTGYRDAITGTACPAADSIVESFGDAPVETNGNHLVNTITSIMRRLRHIAARTGLAPVRWLVAMAPDAFYQITEIWPVNYSTFRGLTSLAGIPGANQVNFNIDSNFVNGMRDAMRGDLYNYTGQFLMVDGQRVDVVLDDAITETDNGNGTFTSDIYFVPMTVLGATPVSYWEYFNYDASGSMEFARAAAPADHYFTSDGGRFMWHKKPPNNFCVQWLAKTEPRILLLTPYLAARLTDVRYGPFEHVRSPFTSSNYFKDGGRTNYTGYGPSYYSPTA